MFNDGQPRTHAESNYLKIGTKKGLCYLLVASKVLLFLLVAERKGLEPSASGVTGRRYNRLNYRSAYSGLPRCEKLSIHMRRLCQILFCLFVHFSYKLAATQICRIFFVAQNQNVGRRFSANGPYIRHFRTSRALHDRRLWYTQFIPAKAGTRQRVPFPKREMCTGMSCFPVTGHVFCLFLGAHLGPQSLSQALFFAGTDTPFS